METPTMAPLQPAAGDGSEDRAPSDAALAAARGALPADAVRLEFAAMERYRREQWRDPGEARPEQLAMAAQREILRERVAEAAQQLIDRYTAEVPDAARARMAWGAAFEADASAAFFEAIAARADAEGDSGAATAALATEGEEDPETRAFVLEQLYEIVGGVPQHVPAAP